MWDDADVILRAFHVEIIKQIRFTLNRSYPDVIRLRTWFRWRCVCNARAWEVIRFRSREYNLLTDVYRNTWARQDSMFVTLFLVPSEQYAETEFQDWKLPPGEWWPFKEGMWILVVQKIAIQPRLKIQKHLTSEIISFYGITPINQKWCNTFLTHRR